MIIMPVIVPDVPCLDDLGTPQLELKGLLPLGNTLELLLLVQPPREEQLHAHAC